ncbi:CIC11C00000001348 [Sungouiella intermedia]|uniref:protein-serine/threonine phosphatase n=1 Tax=Sungouiella intermedia TaxID=45354 RepID=A0A1L0G7R5_9ASCO|nr:CIC11C00000001348 [[Candida] intermedia]
MGQLLSHPVEEKSLDFRSHDSISYCIGSMQGYRMSMEDAHDIRICEDESVAVFGVFDGHGGKEIAEELRDKLVLAVFKTLTNQLRHDAATPLATLLRQIKDCFFLVDANLPEPDAANCGSTAIVTVVIAGRYIISANTGDSRAILSLPGGRSKTLSFDHKPSNMGERVRIENSGGYVVNSRVNEILALSRAFGDFNFKMPWLELSSTGRHNAYLEANRRFARDNLVALPPELYQVTVEPDLLVYDLQALALPEFLVLACDGIWDCYTNDQLLHTIRNKLRDGWNLQHIIEYVLNDCISMASNITGIGFDNMTLMIVVLHPNGTFELWSDTMEKTITQEESTRR